MTLIKLAILFLRVHPIAAIVSLQLDLRSLRNLEFFID